MNKYIKRQLYSKETEKTECLLSQMTNNPLQKEKKKTTDKIIGPDAELLPYEKTIICQIGKRFESITMLPGLVERKQASSSLTKRKILFSTALLYQEMRE